jgi:threonine/homoserine/homoserine lactone efflux protein
MRLVRAGDPPQRQGHVPKLGLAQPPGEVFADAPKVRPCGVSEYPPTRVGQARQHHPAISLEPVPPDQALVDQSVHRASEAAGREHDPLGQLGHPQRVAWSAGQPKEHIVLGERQAVFSVKLLLEPADDVVVSMQERLPGSNLGLAEFARHASYRTTTLFAHTNKSVVPWMLQMLWTQTMAGLGVGLALASAPGPVQAVLMTEAVRGGLVRGFRAMAGANLTFGLLLVGLALGLSVAPPGGPTLRILKVAGGLLLVWLAVDGFRTRHEPVGEAPGSRSLPPAVRGALAVVLNPGAWVFLGTAASSLLSGATRLGGTGSAVLVALALLVGLAVGDGTVVLIGGVGVRRAHSSVRAWVRTILAALLAGLGVWLVVSGLIS